MISSRTTAIGPASQRSDPVGDVPLIYGILDASALPGPILISLLVDCGMREAAARTLLARLRRQGSLTVERVGRVGVYRMSGDLLSRFEKVEHGPSHPSWDGKFRTVIFDLPETERAVKDKIRHLARRANLGTMRSGVLISPNEIPLSLPESSAGLVVTGSVEFSPNESRRVASLAWDLPARDAAIARACRRVAPLLDSSNVPSEPLLAFRIFREEYLATRDARLHDPDLPAELLPDEWQSDRLADLIRSMVHVWSDAVGAHVEAVVARSGHARLVERNVPLFD